MPLNYYFTEFETKAQTSRNASVKKWREAVQWLG